MKLDKNNSKKIKMMIVGTAMSAALAFTPNAYAYAGAAAATSTLPGSGPISTDHIVIEQNDENITCGFESYIYDTNEPEDTAERDFTTKLTYDKQNNDEDIVVFTSENLPDMEMTVDELKEKEKINKKKIIVIQF